jgi:hypothetical protein
MKMSVTYDHEAINAFRNFTKEFPARFEQFGKNMLFSVADQALADIKNILSNVDIAKDYSKSLEVVKVAESGDFAIIANESKVDYSLLISEVDVLYFVKRYGRLSAMDMFLVFNSPFVLGFVSGVPKGIEAIVRRVSRTERNQILDRNLDIKKVYDDTKKILKVPLFPVKFAYIDVYFSMMRLEFGLAGYPMRPHWSVVKNRLDEYVDKFMKKDGKNLFSFVDLLFGKKLKDMTTKVEHEIKPEEVKLLDPFEKSLTH